MKKYFKVNVTIETKGPHEAELRHMLADSGLKFVRSQCEVYIRELKEEFSKGLILPTDKNKPQAAVAKNNTSVINKSQFQNEVSENLKTIWINFHIL